MPTKPSKNFPKHSVDISEEAGVRYLHFGSDWVQGAMRIARPWALELSYTREMMAGLLLRPTNLWPRSAVGMSAWGREVLDDHTGVVRMDQFLYAST